MAQWIWALIAVIGIILIVAVVLLVNRQRRSLALQQRFGPEYTRAVESADDRRAAEAALADRARRRARLEIRPLEEPVRLRYSEQWRRLQEQFVDRPADAVASAEDLLTTVMEDRGYPVGDFEEQAELVSVDHPHVVENYRVAHDIHRRNQSQDATTEDLREAMLRYRSLFDDLLRSDQNLDAGPGDSSDRPLGRSADRASGDIMDADRESGDVMDADRASGDIVDGTPDGAGRASGAAVRDGHLADPTPDDVRDDTRRAPVADPGANPRRRDLRQEHR